MGRFAGSHAFGEENPAGAGALSRGLREYVVIGLDIHGAIVEWSSGAEKVFGYAQPDVAGRHFGLLFTPEDQAANRPEIELSAARSGTSAEHERWQVRKDGSRIWVSGTVSAIRNEAGELTGFSKIARDITSRKLAELQREALLDRERAARVEAERQWKRLEEIAERVPAAIGLVRLPERVYVFANRRLRDFMQGRPVIGRKLGNAIFAGAPELLEIFEEAARTGEPRTVEEHRLQRKSDTGSRDGYFDITFQPIGGEAFSHDAMLIFAADVTGQVRAREALARLAVEVEGERDRLQVEVAERQRAQALAAKHAAVLEEQAGLLNLARDGIMAIRMDGTIELWNSGAEEMYGWSKQEALGRNVHELLQTTFPSPLAEIEEALLAQGQWTGELKHRNRDGEELEVWTRWVLRKHEGSPRGWLEVTRDITERKRLEAHLRETQKMESLGVLAGGIAHDFNNLLTGIMGNINLAEEMIDPASPVRSLLRNAAQASEHAAFLTRQMLAYAGKGNMFVTPVDLSKVARDAMALIRGSIPQNVKLELALAERLPCVKADAAQLQQVAANLILNAVEAIGERPGALAVRTGVQDIGDSEEDAAWDIGTPAPGRYATLEVEDTGGGIDPSVRPNIFDPFYSTKFTGRGLGLAAVSGIVRVLNGAIRVRSEPGERTTFLVLFPAAGA